MSIYPRVDLVFNQISEKALRQVLRIVHGIAAAAHETVERRPISLAKLSQRRPRDFWSSLAFPGRDNHAPMRRSERVAQPGGDGLRERLHPLGLAKLLEKHKPRKTYDFVQHGLRNPFVKGEQSSLQHQQKAKRGY